MQACCVCQEGRIWILIGVPTCWLRLSIATQALLYSDLPSMTRCMRRIVSTCSPASGEDRHTNAGLLRLRGGKSLDINRTHHLVPYKTGTKVLIIRAAHAKYIYHDPEFMKYTNANRPKRILTKMCWQGRKVSGRFPEFISCYCRWLRSKDTLVSATIRLAGYVRSLSPPR